MKSLHRAVDAALARSVRGWHAMSRSVVAWLYLLFVAAVWALSELVGERTLSTTLLAYIPPLVWLIPAPFVVLWTLLRRRGLATALAATLLAAWGAGLLHWRPQSDGTLRVLTFNMARGYRTTPERLGTLLRGADADIILLQEANFAVSGYPEELAASLPGYRMLPAGDVMTLTRLPVVSSATLRLPFILRNVLITRLKYHRQVLSVANAHMGRMQFGDIAHGDVTELAPTRNGREQQLAALQRLARFETGPLLLGGDLNTPPRGLIYRQLQAAVGPDAFDQAGRGPGWTFPALRTRIDHQFARGLTPTRAQVLDVNQSDHRPLLVEYR